MSKIDYERMLRHSPRSQGGTGPELGTGFAVIGGVGPRIERCFAVDSPFGFDVSGSKGMTMQSNVAIGCSVALDANDTENLGVFDFEIDGKCLRDFIGDFEDLTIWSADHLYAVGEMLHETDPSLRVSALKNTPFGQWLNARSFSEWTGFAGLLVAIYAAMKN